MARFDLSKYATVAERIQLFYKDYPTGRIITKNLTTEDDRKRSTWVVKAEIWLPLVIDDAEKLAMWSKQPGAFLKSTGHAFEIDGTGGANATSALENAESSAVGRALALAGYAANKEATTLASREEMQKVAAADTDWASNVAGLTSLQDAYKLYAVAERERAGADVLASIKAKAATFGK